jgi:hypothetical protein
MERAKETKREVKSKFNFKGGRTFGRQILLYKDIYIALINGKKVSYMTHSSCEFVKNIFKHTFGIEIEVKVAGVNCLKLVLVNEE